mgnify:CR=1 FL=1
MTIDTADIDVVTNIEDRITLLDRVVSEVPAWQELRRRES